MQDKPTKEGTLEAKDRATSLVGRYGLKKGLRGRFGKYIPLFMESVGLAAVTHEIMGNKWGRYFANVNLYGLKTL